jgi:integrase
MRGHIVKRYKGSYTIVLNLGVDPATGKRKQQWISVKGTKKEAERRLADLVHQLDTGTFMKPSKTNLAEYLERWLKDYVWPNLAPRTAEGYESIVRQHLIPGLGNITLTQLKPTHLQHYYAEKLSTGRCDGKGALSPQTMRHHHTALHKALQTALEWGLLNRNVADAVRSPHAERPEMHTWGEDEVTRFLQAAKNTPYYALFYSALFTGMRRSELLALRWCDIDLLLCQVYVTRAVHQLRDGSIVYRPPKTAKGRRMIALSPSTALVLKEHKEKQEAIRGQFGFSVTDEDLIFNTLEGKPIRPNTVTRAWSDLAKRCGLNVIRLHDARHTHASLMLKQGIHPKIVQERLGHSTIAVTLDTYSHVSPGLQEAAAKRFDESFLTSYNKSVESELVKKGG